jgi:hypothetical protein
MSVIVKLSAQIHRKKIKSQKSFGNINHFFAAVKVLMKWLVLLLDQEKSVFSKKTKNKTDKSTNLPTEINNVAKGFCTNEKVLQCHFYRITPKIKHS